jgi:hypothetical protein
MTQDGNIHPACALCRGACCEFFALRPKAWGWPADVAQWLEFHGEPSPLEVMFNLPCKKLVDGKCSCYVDRPKMCAEFAVGSDDCRTCIKLRRRPEQAAEILKLVG